MKAIKRSVNTYYGIFSQKYKYQYGDYITNSYSILKLETELEKSVNESMINNVKRFVDDFENNYKYSYSINAKEVLEYFKINDIFSLKNNYGIGRQEFKKAYNLVHFDKVNIKEKNDYSMYIIEFVKKNEIVGYLLPCKTF